MKLWSDNVGRGGRAGWLRGLTIATLAGAAVLAPTAALPATAAATATRAAPAASALPPLTNGDWLQYRDRAPGGGWNQAETTLSRSTVPSLNLVRTVHGRFEGDQAGAVGHGLLYTGGDFGGVRAYDPTTGALRWHSVRGSGLISLGGSAVYSVDRRGVAALDAATGHLLWTRALPWLSQASPPTVLGNHLVVGYNADHKALSWGAVSVLNVSTGRLLATTILPEQQVSTPAVSGSIAVVTLDSATVDAIDLLSGRVLWTVPVTGASVGISVPSPVIRGSRVYVGGADGTFRALQLSTGAVIWSRHFAGEVIATAAADGTSVYAAAVVVGGGSDLARLSAADGTLVWQRSAGIDFASPTLADGVLYVPRYYTGDGMSAYDASTGARLFDWSSPYTVITEPMVSHGRVYLGDERGNLRIYAV